MADLPADLPLKAESRRRRAAEPPAAAGTFDPGGCPPRAELMAHAFTRLAQIRRLAAALDVTEIAGSTREDRP